MGDTKPPVTLDLSWDGQLQFTARAEDVQFTLDGDRTIGPAPMQMLAASLAGCMAIDLVHILTKGRQPLVALRARLTGERADQEPRRFERIALHFTIQGDVQAGAVERSIALSHEKYCSVWHSLRQDIDLQITYDIVAAADRAGAH
ncbi:MAG: OsmC family protein [Acidobacteriota bacterium]|nr:OsmC family protein [Acidobacteriota bacterium]